MESIYQSRGFVSCLKQGFTFVLANPKTVMKAMWVLLLIISISDVFLYAFAEKMSMDLLHLKIGTGTILATLGFYGSVLFQIFLSIAGLFYFGRYIVLFRLIKQKDGLFCYIQRSEFSSFLSFIDYPTFSLQFI